ncbi:tRNA pseudouridine synthase 1 [Orbilia brochopaga]|uniref:tRNA pseudouridine synthase 1 n=1 Tax=Orbilia brochopaga TaxID=3140254 RepID=A0AAV9UFI5_9PEZI
MLVLLRCARSCPSKSPVAIPPRNWLRYKSQSLRFFASDPSFQSKDAASPDTHDFKESQAKILYEDEYLATPRLPNVHSPLLRVVYGDLVGFRPRAFNDYMEQQEKEERDRSPKDGSDSESRKRPAGDASGDRPEKKFKHMGRNEFKRAVKKDWKERKAIMEKTGKDPAAMVDEEGAEVDSSKKAIWKKTRKLIETGTRAPRELADGEEKEERKPKKKVAVLIGYCGSGYRGMQLNPPTKTIEGDLFEAFVRAGAISKANSDDPKKSSFVRCARTDKGVHAAGNVISLKMIIESPTVIEDINNQLVPQIRVWDIIQTTNAFSCYQFCDSRVYEYLVPTYCFLPPHPKTYMARTLAKLAEEENDLENWKDRYDDVPEFWQKTLEQVRTELVAQGFPEDIIQQVLSSKADEPEEQLPTLLDDHPSLKKKLEESGDQLPAEDQMVVDNDSSVAATSESKPTSEEQSEQSSLTDNQDANPKQAKTLHQARKIQKQIIIRAKRAFRIPPVRLERIRQAFKLYEGNHSFHNFTIQKTFKDASSKRYIKSFNVSDPIIIDDTEWLSLKVHGQSFMMHQIRKMVGLVMLTVRYGCPLGRIQEAYGKLVIPIPKAPALGLLLDHPVFETYNKKADQHGRSHLTFEPYKDKIQEFKQKHIYDKLFMEEQKLQTFNAFLSFLDNFETTEFEYLSSRGMKAIPEVHRRPNKEASKSTEDEQLTALLELEEDEENVDS